MTPIIVYITLGVCALLVALLIVRYDMYDREPVWLLLVVAAVGAGVMAVMGPIEDFTIGLWGGPSRAWVVAMVASTHEELAKLLIVVAVACITPRHFNDPMDGIIYGSIAGLGMAVNESIHYMALTPPEGVLLPAAEVVRVLAHPVMGGIAGFGVGLATIRHRAWPVWVAACLVIATSVHFAWDVLALTQAARLKVDNHAPLVAACIMIGTFCVYGYLVLRGHALSRETFDPDSKRRLWGWPLSMLIKDDNAAAQQDSESI